MTSTRDSQPPRRPAYSVCFESASTSPAWVLADGPRGEGTAPIDRRSPARLDSGAAHLQRAYLTAASRSPSSSHAFTPRITSSRAGTPRGNRACKSASRSTPPDRLRLVRAAGCPGSPLDRSAREVLLALALRAAARRAVLVTPRTPWARFRCAPSDAARPNAFPHSGHTNPSLLVLFDLVFLPLADLGRAVAMRSHFLPFWGTDCYARYLSRVWMAPQLEPSCTTLGSRCACAGRDPLLR